MSAFDRDRWARVGGEARDYLVALDELDAVAVYCRCHDDDEVDIQPLAPGEEPHDVACSACGSREVVVEKLPPSTNTWRVEQ